MKKEQYYWLDADDTECAGPFVTAGEAEAGFLDQGFADDGDEVLILKVVGRRRVRSSKTLEEIKE